MPAPITPTEQSVINQGARALVHMRQQVTDARFGLVLGAGASKDLGFPLWDQLLDRIAEHADVAAGELLKAAREQTSRSQLLYQHYRTQAIKKLGGINEYNRQETTIKSGWQKIVHECLYRGVTEDVKELQERDKYLQTFIPVIKQTRLTINYNFDDSLERMLAAARTPDERRATRGFVTVWSPHSQLLPRDAVIYHPNGFLPRHLREKSSEHLVFLEDAFADQLIESMAGHYSSLLYHLAQTTRLFIGHSLSDPTLRHLLRQNAKMYPGHYHYFVAHVREGDEAAAHRKSVFDSNFEVYNLVTLFLTTDEIAALGNLLSKPEDEFNQLMEECGQKTAYKFMITGAVSVGKSTAVAQFGSLRMHDEWLEPRSPGMEKDPKLLTPEETAQIDAWVVRQLELKNLAMLGAKSGVHVIDRAPLDAFAFTPAVEWKKKAGSIEEGVKGNLANRRLCPASIILLIGDPHVMAVRGLLRHKQMDAQRLGEEQKQLKHVYEQHSGGVAIIDARDKSVAQVTKGP